MVDLVINKIYLIIFFWNKIIYKSYCKAAGDFLANEKIGKIYYSAVPRTKQSADWVAEQHSTKVELVEDPLVVDIFWGVYEGKTYQETFGDEKGGDYMFHPEKLIILSGPQKPHLVLLVFAFVPGLRVFPFFLFPWVLKSNSPISSNIFVTPISSLALVSIYA